jgi:hypothetical protein
LNNKKAGSVCPVCGKDRIIVKTFKEHIGNAVVVTTITACPDKQCQARLDDKLAGEKKVRDGMKLEAEKRLQERKLRAPALREAKLKRNFVLGNSV